MEKILKKYMEGIADPAEEAMAREWLSEHLADPVSDGIFSRIYEEIEGKGLGIPAEKVEAAVGEKITASEEASRKIRRVRLGAWLSAAAAVVAVTMAGWLLKRDPAPVAEWKMAYSAKGETMELSLPDGTRLWMDSDTRVLYPSAFTGEERTVYVDGAVFADVAPDREHPFLMSTPGMKIRVLGTRFNVSSYAGDPSAEVALVSGSVEVEAEVRTGEKPSSRSWIMRPGDFRRLDKDSGVLESYRIDTGTPEAWTRRGNLRFVDKPLSGIVLDLERHFGERISIADESLAATRYYASFVNDEPLDRILTALNPRIRIRRENGGIILSLK